MEKLASQRLAVLVDAENLEITTDQLHQRRVDYRALLEAVNGREIIRALYFKPADRLTAGLRYVVQGLGFEVKTPPKNVDCWLTISAVSLADKCDTIALFAGDKDYEPLVWYLRSRGVRVEVWMWEDMTANDLIAAADHFEPLTLRCLLEPRLAPQSPKPQPSLPLPSAQAGQAGPLDFPLPTAQHGELASGAFAVWREWQTVPDRVPLLTECCRR